jgi:uncharacterized protein YggE
VASVIAAAESLDIESRDVRTAYIQVQPTDNVGVRLVAR